jgi:hypothetical protein
LGLGSKEAEIARETHEKMQKKGVRIGRDQSSPGTFTVHRPIAQRQLQHLALKDKTCQKNVTGSPAKSFEWIQATI